MKSENNKKEVSHNQPQKEEKNIFNNLPMICLVEILSFIDSDKNCLQYRTTSKKINEAVLKRLFMKTQKGDAEFYKKCFLVLNQNSHKYFIDNIYPFLINADTVYDFFNDYNEEIFNKFFNYCFNELKIIKETNNLKLKEKNLEKSFKRIVKKFIVMITIKNFKKEQYTSLDFSKLTPYEDAFDMIILLIGFMKEITYLNLSNILINDEILLSKLINKISLRDKFTLILEEVYLSTDILKDIKLVMDKNMNIKIVIDKKYKKEMNMLGGKKLNKIKNLNQKKFKYIEFTK